MRIAAERAEQLKGSVGSPVYDVRGSIAFAPIRSSERHAHTGLSKRYAVTPDGRLVSRQQAENEFALRHLRDWGRLGIDSAHLLHQLRPDASASLLVVSGSSTTGVHRRASELGLASKTAPGLPAVLVRGEKSALRELAKSEAISKAIFAGSTHAEPAGVSYGSTVYIPTLPWPPSQAVTSRSTFYHSTQSRFGMGVNVGILEGQGGRGIYQFETSAGQVLDIPYNGRGCLLASDHEAFHYNPIEYMNGTPFMCTSDADCREPCSAGGVPRCLNSECVSDHQTGVASRVSGTVSQPGSPSPTFTPYHAAEARLLVANHFDAELFGSYVQIVITDEALLEAYHWLHGGGASSHVADVVNESFNVGSPLRPLHAWLADYYARTHGTLFVQAAGNDDDPISGSDPGDPSEYPEVGCDGLNAVCVGATENTSLYPTHINEHRLWFRSRWRNPTRGGVALEIEEPDLVAEGAGVGHVARTDTMNQWTNGEGTSLAAPLVSGLAALVMETCPGVAAGGAGLQLRNEFRTQGTFERHNVEAALPSTLPPTCPGYGPLAYPTPHLLEYPGIDDCDYKSGTGVLTSRFLPGRRYGCDGGQEEPHDPHDPDPGDKNLAVTNNPVDVQQSSPVDTEHDLPWEPIPSNEEGPDPSAQADAGTAAGASPLRIHRAGQGPARWAPIWSFRDAGYSAGTRVRASIAYYSCPMQPLSTFASFDSNGEVTIDSAAMMNVIGDVAPARNFDLVLRGLNQGNWEVITVSESLHDVNEGFDVVLQQDYERLEARVIDWEDGSCALMTHLGHNESMEFDAIVEYAQ